MSELRQRAEVEGKEGRKVLELLSLPEIVSFLLRRERKRVLSSGFEPRKERNEK